MNSFVPFLLPPYIPLFQADSIGHTIFIEYLLGERLMLYHKCWQTMGYFDVVMN